MQLTPEHRLAWRNALFEAFPTEDRLVEMVYVHLGENPDAIAPGAGLNARILGLLRWAEGTGEDARLLASARAANPTHPKLQKLAQAERPGPVEHVDEHHRKLDEQIEERFQRRAQLELRRSVAGGAEAAAITAELTALDAEILDLQRRQRSGPELRPNEILGKRYQLAARIGDGSFGRVWRAYDRMDRRNVAVKVLHGHLAHDRSARDRFFRGAKQMALLRHPNIVGVVDRGGEDRGHHYFVMELVEGSLREAVARGLPMADRVRLIVEVAGALHCAHQAGVVHRDVKPDNILVDTEMHARLTDFDLVHVAGPITNLQTAMMGTPGFIAPEVLDSVDGLRNASARSDIYSLGVTTIFAIAGDTPSLLQLARDPFGVIARLDGPLALKPILARAIAWRPRDRHASALDFGRALEAALSSVADPAPPAELPVIELLRRLEALDDEGWNAIAARLEVPLDQLPSAKASRRHRSIELIRFIQHRGPLDELASVLPAGETVAETSPLGHPKALDTAAEDWEELLERACQLDEDAFLELVLSLNTLPSADGGNVSAGVRFLGRRIDAAADLLALGDQHPRILDGLVAALRPRVGAPARPAGGELAARGLWAAIIHAKMMLVLDKIERALDAPARPILDDLRALVRHRGFARLIAGTEALQIEFYRAAPRHASSNVRVALPLLGRLFTLAVELPEEWRRHEGDAALETRTPRTGWMGLYRALCLLPKEAFAEATAAVIPRHLMVSREVARARRVLEILRVAERWRVSATEVQRWFSPWLDAGPVENAHVEDASGRDSRSGPLTPEALPRGVVFDELCFRLGFERNESAPGEDAIRFLAAVEPSVIHRELAAIRAAVAPRWSPDAPPLRAMEPADREALLDRLFHLDEQGWSAAVEHFGLGTEYLLPDIAAVTSRAIGLYWVLDDLPGGIDRLLAWLDQRG